MTKDEKIKALQRVIGHPNRGSVYYKLFEDMGDLKFDYCNYMTTKPVDCDLELERLPLADYELCSALFIMLLREDYFSTGALKRRYEAGQVDDILVRMVEKLKEEG